MSDQVTKTPSRAELLKQLREMHRKSFEQTQALFREQRQLQNSICQLIRQEPKTVPQIAAELNKPTHEILWFVSALKKYGIVAEMGMCGDYPLYQRVKEQ
jgi:predicted transcriptional regulator